MENKYVSIEMLDEMAKVKKSFKMLLITDQQDLIERMLGDMSQEEKDALLRLYIYEDMSKEEKDALLRSFTNGNKR